MSARAGSGAHSSQSRSRSFFGTYSSVMKLMPRRESASSSNFWPLLHHLLDLTLPARLLEPGVGEHLLGAVVVAVVHLDRDVVRQLVLVLVEGREPDKARVRHRHAHRLVGEVDRALLHDRCRCRSPTDRCPPARRRGSFSSLVQPLHQPPHAARRLAPALDDDAAVALPELVLVEARPHGVLLDRAGRTSPRACGR